MTLSKTWSFHNPVQIHFGSGSISRLSAFVPSATSLLVTSSGFTQRGVTAAVKRQLSGCSVHVFDRVVPNPDLDSLTAAAAELRPLGVTQILAVGGGSVLDSAKVLGVLMSPAAAGFSLHQHFHEGLPLPPPPFLPIFAIPTAAGTGAEVTPFATVWDMTAHKKHSVASPFLYPRAAVLDPDLTLGLPWDITLSTGLDALSQALESIWNRHATPMTLALAFQAVRLALRALPGLAADGGNVVLRSELMSASLMAGLCISQTRTALAHSISYPLTAWFGMPHGLACGFTLPEILEYNLTADDGRLQDLAQSLGLSNPPALCAHLEKTLAELNVAQAVARHVQSFQAVVPHLHEMLTPGRADNNLRPADVPAVGSILEKTFARCLAAPLPA